MISFKRKPTNIRTNEKGAVLLTTLLLMTVMAALAVAIMDDIRFSVKRTISVQTGEQLDWYMRGAESYAENWLQENGGDDQAVLTQVIKTGEPIIFPLGKEGDESMLSIAMSDGRNCFNINRLAKPKTKQQTRIAFAKLLQDLEFDNLEASTFAAHIQDWVDADVIPEPGGGEDLTYSNMVPPYHTANTLMVDITELRAIDGIDEENYQRIKPYVCALPTTKKNKLNLNTLDNDDWPLLASIFGRADDGRKAAQAVIALRPLAGYESVEAVWALPIVKRLKLKGAGKDMVAVKTDLVNMDIQVLMDLNGVAHARHQKASFAFGTETGVALVARRSVH